MRRRHTSAELLDSDARKSSDLIAKCRVRTRGKDHSGQILPRLREQSPIVNAIAFLPVENGRGGWIEWGAIGASTSLSFQCDAAAPQRDVNCADTIVRIADAPAKCGDADVRVGEYISSGARDDYVGTGVCEWLISAGLEAGVVEVSRLIVANIERAERESTLLTGETNSARRIYYRARIKQIADVGTRLIE